MESKVNLRPLGNRVLVSHIKAEKMSGGIILPDTAQEKKETAKVIAIGAGKKLSNGDLIKPPFKVGDTVLIDKYAGQEVKLDDNDYLILNIDEVIAIIE